jgi:ubiquinone/menaquinone biosynthesis C-methylase UbiE
LPFAEASFDLVVCQFGLMFVPTRCEQPEARRVLRQGGHYMLVIRDRIEHNRDDDGRRAVAELFPIRRPDLQRVPFRYHEIGQIEQDLLAADSADIEFGRSSCAAALFRP